MSVGRTIYNALFRRTSTFVATILVGAVIFERTFDPFMDGVFYRMNRGVSVVYLSFVSIGCRNMRKYTDLQIASVQIVIVIRLSLQGVESSVTIDV